MFSQTNQMLSARSNQTPMSYFPREKVHHNTGLMRDIFQTEEHIVEGFWVQGEFASFLTLDEQNQLYLEMYGFDTENIFSICDKILLGDLSKSYQLQAAINSNRDLIAVVFMDEVSAFYAYDVLERKN